MDGNATGPVTFLVTALAMGITTLIRGRESGPLFWQSPDALGQAEDTGTLPLALGLAVLAFGLFLGFVIFSQTKNKTMNRRQFIATSAMLPPLQASHSEP